MTETDSDESAESSGTDFEDHVSVVSEHSDIESGNTTDITSTATTVSAGDVQNDQAVQLQAIPPTRRGRGSRGRGLTRGRGQRGDVTSPEACAGQTVSQPLCGKDKFS